MRHENSLFAQKDMHSFLESRKATARSQVENIPPEQLIRSSDDQVADYVCDSMHIEPLVLYDERATSGYEEIEIEMTGNPRFSARGDGRAYAHGTRLTVTIPFTGDGSLWQVRPSQHYLRSFPGRVVHRDEHGVGSLVLHIEKTINTQPAEFRNAYDYEIKLIKEMVSHISTDLSSHQSQLKNEVRALVKARRDRLDKQAKMQEAVNIPLKTRPGAPSVVPIVVPRKLVKPLPSPKKFEPENTIRSEDYEHILSVIRHEGRSFETTPVTFAKHDEEELRDIIMAHLNGHYQGAATGERFRRKGKTDICIEDENRAAFVAECKVWRGGKEAVEAASQLLSYTTWRDCKCSLIFFNTKNAGFTDVQISLAEVLRKHPSFNAEVQSGQNGEWRFQFKQPSDAARLVTIHVFCFDLFVAAKSKK